MRFPIQVMFIGILCHAQVIMFCETGVASDVAMMHSHTANLLLHHPQCLQNLVIFKNKNVCTNTLMYIMTKLQKQMSTMLLLQCLLFTTIPSYFWFFNSSDCLPSLLTCLHFIYHYFQLCFSLLCLILFYISFFSLILRLYFKYNFSTFPFFPLNLPTCPSLLPFEFMVSFYVICYC